MRIVFMGTPDFAAASLQKLIDEDFDVVVSANIYVNRSAALQSQKEYAVNIASLTNHRQINHLLFRIGNDPKHVFFKPPLFIQNEILRLFQNRVNRFFAFMLKILSEVQGVKFFGIIFRGVFVLTSF